MPDKRSIESAPATPDDFPATRWSLVAAAGADAAKSQASLAELCARYWYPVYAYVRRCGHDPSRADAIVRAFFNQLVDTARSGRPGLATGRFRDFVLAQLNAFLAAGWSDLQLAAGAELAPPLPAALLEQRLQLEAGMRSSPEQGFRASFAIEVLSRALQRLRNEAAQAGRESMLDALEPYLTREPEPGQYPELARQLGMQVLSVTIAVKRLRQRYRELADAELAETVASNQDLEVERAALHAALRDLP